MDEKPSESMAMGVIPQVGGPYYRVLSVWGFALHLGWFRSLLLGLTAGLVIGLFNWRIISKQQDADRARGIMFSMCSLLGGIGTIIGVLGLIVLVVRQLFV